MNKSLQAAAIGLWIMNCMYSFSLTITNGSFGAVVYMAFSAGMTGFSVHKYFREEKS